MTTAATVRERPILFSGPMVRAILDGSKTQTRRVMTPQMEHREIAGMFGGRMLGWPRRDGGAWLWPNARDEILSRCPYGRPGDRLWVRETWQYYDWTEQGEPQIRYAADETTRWCETAEEDEVIDVWEELSRQENYRIANAARDHRWRPSIFMKRWASRLTLELTEVRVERVQETSDVDSLEEGISYQNVITGARGRFRRLWDSINAKRGYGWDANPWVWVLTFRRLEVS